MDPGCTIQGCRFTARRHVCLHGEIGLTSSLRSTTARQHPTAPWSAALADNGGLEKSGSSSRSRSSTAESPTARTWAAPANDTTRRETCSSSRCPSAVSSTDARSSVCPSTSAYLSSSAGQTTLRASTQGRPSTLIYLRGLASAIARPYCFGLVPRMPKPAVQRRITLVGKSSSLANLNVSVACAEHTRIDKDMLTSSKVPTMSNFLLDVSTLRPTPPALAAPGNSI
jgi:hypothetical protein